MKPSPLNFFLALLFALVVSTYGASESDEHDHDHEHEHEHGFEMAAAIDIGEPEAVLFVLEKGSHDEHHEGEGHDDHDHDHDHDHDRLLRELSGEEEEEEEEAEYAYDHLKMVMILLNQSCSSESIEVKEDDAIEFLEDNTTVYEEIEAFDASFNISTNVLYRVEFHVEEATFISLFSLNPLGSGCLVMYSEHSLEEGFLREASGHVIEPTFVEPEEDETFGNYPAEIWLVTLGAALLIALTSFLGAFLLLVRYRKQALLIVDYIEECLAFAFGVILGLVFFHLFPEAIEFYGDFDYKMGVVVLGTILASFLVKMIFGDHTHSVEEIALDKKVDIEEEDSFVNASIFKDHGTSFNLLWGDFFCNFVDGVVIAAGFAVCDDNSLGWLLTASIFLHEAPQEIADLMVFYNDFKSVKMALLLNLISAIGTILGALLVLSIGQVSSSVQGILLAIGSAALLFICIGEIAPKLISYPNKNRAILRVVLIVIGYSIMGLTLLSPHGHCEVGHDDHGHGGHGHD